MGKYGLKHRDLEKYAIRYTDGMVAGDKEHTYIKEIYLDRAECGGVLEARAVSHWYSSNPTGDGRDELDDCLSDSLDESIEKRRKIAVEKVRLEAK